MKKPHVFWFTIKDNDTKTFDVKGPISDDTRYLFMVTDAQRNGFHITCDSPDADCCSEAEVCAAMEGYGFKRDTNLFQKVSLMGMKGNRTNIC